MDLPPEGEFSCHTSLAADEPLAGRGTRVNNWLAIGHPGPWQRKALPESDLPEAVKRHLQRFETVADHSRVQFIRQPGLDPEYSIPLFLACSDSKAPWLVRLDLQDYEQLLDMRWEELLEAGPPTAPEAEPIFLVCVNGRRDLCCARYGQPVYEALAGEAPDRTWQTTHLGGHRFAATAVVLPHGLHYGRIQPNQAADLMALTQAGRISIQHLRGRTSYPPPAQAAEIELRIRLRMTQLNGLKLSGLESLREAEWMVTFEQIASGELLRVRVRLEPERFRVISTTGDSEWSATGEYEAEVVGRSG